MLHWTSPNKINAMRPIDMKSPLMTMVQEFGKDWPTPWRQRGIGQKDSMRRPALSLQMGFGK